MNGKPATYKRYYTSKEYTPWFHKPLKTGSNDTLPEQVITIPYADWINSEEVRNLLHVPKQVQAWEVCSNSLVYNQTAHDS